MANVMRCGLEENNLTATMWNSTTGTLSVGTTPVHSGTYSLRVNPTAAAANVQRNAATNITSGTHYFRIYVRIASMPSGATSRLLACRNSSSSTACYIELSNVDNKLRVFNVPVAVNVVDPAGALSTDTWYRIEFRYLISDTVGQLEVRRYTGDSTTPDSTFGVGNFTGGDGTDRDTLATNFNQFLVGSAGSTATCDYYFDDIGWNDDSGTVNNSWCGPGKIALLIPDSDDTVAWTDATGTGTGNAGEVDELPGAPDDDTSYVTSSTANQEDRYNLASLPAEVTSDATIKIVNVYARIRGEGTTSTRQCRVLLWDEGGSQTNGPTTALNDSTAYAVMGTADHLSFDAATAATTKTDIDSFDVGAEPLTAHPTRLTAIWVNVEWIEAVASSDVFFENRHPIEHGMKPLTAAGIGGVLIE